MLGGATQLASQAERWRGDGHDPVVGAWTLRLVLVWICGTLLFDKGFAYLRLGPLYVTELVLAALVLANLGRLRLSDLIFAAILVFYVGVGLWKYGDVVMVGKDFGWFYFLLFLRFFPRNFPARYVRYVTVVAVASALIATTQGFVGFRLVPLVKYGVAVTFWFLLIYVAARREGRLPLVALGAFCAMAVATDFKTLILMTLAMPWILRHAGAIGRIWNRRSLALVSVAVLLMAYKNSAIELMTAGVQALNWLAGFLSFRREWTLGTAAWRAEIWTGAIRKLVANGDLLFGEFPGHNFLDWRYLNISRGTGLEGGNGLGTVRTAHNIVVQMVMKSGVVGLASFFFFYFKWLPRRRYVIIMHAMVMACAMTADILEVPSRGPLLYALTWCLVLALDRMAVPAQDVDGHTVERVGTGSGLLPRGGLGGQDREGPGSAALPRPA